MLARHFRDLPFVRGVGVGMQEANGYRFGMLASQPPQSLDRRALVDRLYHLAGPVDPLLDLERQPARYQRRRFIEQDIVTIRPDHPLLADLKKVAEAGGC